MMDDKISYMKELQQQLLQELNHAFGMNIKSLDELTDLKKLLPEEFRKLQDLCLFLEADFLKCDKAKAYFSGCLSGAAMIEAFLLMLCWLNKDEVIATAVYKKHAKARPFDAVWGSLSLELLIEIAETLKWIPSDLVKAELSTAIALSYEEIAISKGLDTEAIAEGKQALLLHPATALFGLMRDLRNCLHAGRWIRQNKAFNPDPFDEWSHLGVILIAEIRDCLIVKMTRDIQAKFTKAVAELEGSIAKLQAALAKTAS
jgi:hypothetical protein